MKHKDLASRAHEVKEMHGLTQEELAGRMGVTRSAISRAVNWTDNPNMSGLRKEIIEELTDSVIEGPIYLGNATPGQTKEDKRTGFPALLPALYHQARYHTIEHDTTMQTQAAPEAKGDGEGTEAGNAVLRLRRHYLSHVKDVDGNRRIGFLAFAYDSPFDLLTPKELAEDYRDTDLSELRALREQAEESSQMYFGILESAIEGGTDDQKEIEKRWREFCMIVARKNVVQILLTSAAIHGPKERHNMVQSWDSPVAGG